VAIPQIPQVESFEDNALTRWYEEKGNFKLQFDLFPSALVEARQKVEIMIGAGGDLPETLVGFNFSEESVLNMGIEGAAIPLNDYYKNWAYYINEVLPRLKNQDFMQWLTSADGNIYYVPKANEQVGNMYHLRSWINKSWLDKLGLTMPTTTDEFRKVLAAFVSQDPNGNKIKDEIGLIGGLPGWGAQAASWVMNAFIYDDDQNRYIVDDSGKVDAAYTQAEWREGLRYIRGLVKDGLMLPQSFTMTDAQITQILESGDTSTVGSFTHGLFLFGAVNERKYEYAALPPLIGPKGTSHAAFFPDIPQKNFIITRSNKNPEASFRWADLMCSEEGYMRTRWGIPDVDWKKSGPDDKSYLDFIGFKAMMIPILPWMSVQKSHWTFYTAGILPLGVADGQVAATDNPLAGQIWIASSVLFYLNKEPKNRVDIQKFTREEAEELKDLRNTINTYVNETIALFAVGEMDIEKDWETYLKDLDNMGLKRYLEISQSGYDRVVGKKVVP
jgi:putative aldouronate transport system substrate-binding protein